MYIFGLLIQKLSVGKEFQLVRRGFGQKNKKHTKKLEDQIWKQKQFHSNCKNFVSNFRRDTKSGISNRKKNVYLIALLCHMSLKKWS